MVITFNAYNCGLGNNGGSRTIIKSADALSMVGHDVNICARLDNFTWFQHKSVIKNIPTNSNAVVAVSACDVVHSLDNAPLNSCVAWWMRGWEIWQTDGIDGFISLAKKVPVICNSSWMVNMLADYGINANLCFSGLDL